MSAVFTYMNELPCLNPMCMNFYLERRPGQRYCSPACGNQARWATTWVELTREQRRMAEEMLAELQSQRLEVVLVPSREGVGMIRAVSEQNPEWYREFCRLYPSRRRRSHLKQEFDTAISRKTTIKGLEHLLEGNVTSPYAERLLNFINRRLKNGGGGK